MDVLKLVQELNDQFGTEIIPVIKMACVPDRAVGYCGGGAVHLLGSGSQTSIRDIRLDLTQRYPALQILLHHNGCARWTQGRVVKNVPYFCKYCGAEALTQAEAASLGVPVNEKVKKGMEVSVIGPTHYYGNRIANSPSHFNLYYRDDQWWHVCPEGPGDKSYRKSRMTVRKFPHTCKKCKQTVGAEGWSLNTAFKLPHFLGDSNG